MSCDVCGQKIEDWQGSRDRRMITDDTFGDMQFCSSYCIHEGVRDLIGLSSRLMEMAANLDG